MMLNRRQFVRAAARTLIASAAGAELLASVSCGASNSAAPLPENRWSELARRLTGTLVRPGDPGFAALALPNNLRYASVLPSGIALCANSQDVSRSILWAREYDVPLVARSGGHSYGGYSTTTGLMIDVRTMNALDFDRSTGVVTLGGGALNANVYSGLRSYDVAITHGRCYRVGVAGLVLGGGVGFNMRSNGITSDLLIETEIVTANGQTHQLSERQNADLFWACRGAGGGNFGIHTSFRFQTFPVGRITVYHLTWKQQPDEVLSALLVALDAAPSRLGCKVSVIAPTAAERAAGKGLAIQLIGQLVGTARELAEMLQPAYAIARPVGEIREMGYWAGQDFLAEQGGPEYFHESSRFFNEPISDGAMALVLDGMRRWPGTTTSATFKLFQTGGVMNAVAPGATAFVHRKSLWLSSVSVVWGAQDSSAQVQRSLEWQGALYHAYAPYATGGAYQNFIDPSLRDWKSEYYESNLARLEAVKARVDPNRVFRFPEAIPPK